MLPNSQKKQEIVIIGAGLSGLICSILLNRFGFPVTVIEKKTFPFHRVCGEYVSNEVVPFLKTIDIDLDDLNASNITKLEITSASGKSITSILNLGGRGISRYKLDNYLFKKAVAEGVNFIQGKKATDIHFTDNQFHINLEDGKKLEAGLIIASYGKRSNLDQKLQRGFFQIKSPYVGIKYHIQTDFPADVIQLDIFPKGYCGIVKVEDNKYCLCYLAERESLKQLKTIPNLEQEILFKNPAIKNHFEKAQFLYEKPEVINEISFEKKTLIENHILFCGDAAGMITPLCGNGMAMAIHSAKILCDTIKHYPNFNELPKRELLEKEYTRNWETTFAFRLKAGRIIQSLFRKSQLTDATFNFLTLFPSFSKIIIGLTHGKPFL